VGTTVIIKSGKARYAWVTILPLAWLFIITMTASFTKIFSSDPRLGFLAHASTFSQQMAQGVVPKGVKSLADAGRIVFNDRVDAAVAAFFALSVIVILANSAREWLFVVRGTKPAISTEVPFEGRVAVAGD
jgi:carbon starvation protein